MEEEEEEENKEKRFSILLAYLLQRMNYPRKEAKASHIVINANVITPLWMGHVDNDLSI